MPAYRAIVSFTGRVSMHAGQTAELTDKEIIKDLLKAGYIEELKAQKTPVRKRKVKKDED